MTVNVMATAKEHARRPAMSGRFEMVEQLLPGRQRFPRVRRSVQGQIPISLQRPLPRDRPPSEKRTAGETSAGLVASEWVRRHPPPRLDPPHRAASPAVPALIGSGSPSSHSAALVAGMSPSSSATA